MYVNLEENAFKNIFLGHHFNKVSKDFIDSNYVTISICIMFPFLIIYIYWGIVCFGLIITLKILQIFIHKQIDFLRLKIV